MRRLVAGILLMLLSVNLSVFVWHTTPVRAEPTTWIVDDDGPADFHTIQEAVNNANAGDTILVKNGTYVGNVHVSKNLSLLGESQESTIVGDGFWFSGNANGSKISGFTISAFTPEYNGIVLDSLCNVTIYRNNIVRCEVGISLRGSSNSSISGNNITNNGYGILLESSSNNSIIGNNIQDNAYDGLVLDSSLSNSISGNTFTNDGLTISSSYQNSVQNNTVNGKPLVYLEGMSNCTVDEDAGQVILVGCRNMRVEGLDISGTEVGVELWETNNSVISGNNIRNNDVGISLGSSSSNSISGNNITNNGYGIGLGSASSNSIFGNNITNNTFAGINAGGSANNSISWNNITDDEFGIHLYSSSNNGIFENNVENSYFGVLLMSSSNNSISGNNITNSDGNGIWLHYRANYNSISGNNIENNGDGIELEYSIFNVIFGNNIRTNGRGVSLYSMASGEDSSNNMIYHNYFINNTLQARITKGTNTWDDGYPSGGNYWSDYAGMDGNGDGIGDTPYVINENNIDHYPLMKPWTQTPPVITATVDICPQTLNLKSKGKWITVHIELPEGYDAADINSLSIMLNNTVPAEMHLNRIKDCNGNDIQALMVKFDREEVIKYILSSVTSGKRSITATLTLTGKLNDGTPFQGSCTIKIITHFHHHYHHHRFCPHGRLRLR